jgi:primosomal protein N' (replication factor Y) (superfamily II helicase)
MPLFARVAVGIALRQEFDYRVPDPYLDLIKPGMRVLVPFGPRLTTGYVTAVADSTDYQGKLKSVADILDKAPAFNAKLMELLRFSADYYRVPLGELMRKALPPSMHASEKTRVHLTDAGKAAVNEDSHPDLKRLEARGLTLRRAREIYSPTLLSQYEEEGLIERRQAVQHGGPGEVLERRVKVARYEAKLISGPKQQELVDYLLQHGVVRVADLKLHFKAPDRLIKVLSERGVLEVEKVRVFRSVESAMEAPKAPAKLNADQLLALDAIVAGLNGDGFHSFLLNGVTGSGKTEVYMHAILRVLELGQQALVLVPEIALTPQLMATFRSRFGDQVAILHSALSPGERYDQWCQVAAGTRPIVVGARSAVFCPLDRLGLVVVDEEHEPSFKQDDRPFYNARDLALVRGHQAGATVVLGSATPSLESQFNVQNGKFTELLLPRRATPRPLPDVVLVDLKEAGFLDEDRIVSRALAKAIDERLKKGEQSILFINRKGFAAFLLCEACGAVPRCPHCDISLTLYKRSGLARCHYCQFATPSPAQCPTCNSDTLKEIGAGTERVAEVLAEHFPTARIARLDSTTSGGKRLTNTLSAFRRGELDILVGTQIVAKGHDFPGVTLVGVLLADIGLSFPDFRASERTFQLLTQVAGRAGRGEVPGQVYVQTYLPNHYSLLHAQRHDFASFAEEELAQRRFRRYPPYGCLALFRFNGPELERVREAAQLAAKCIQPHVREGHIEILGPGLSPLSFLRNRYRMQIMVKANSRKVLQRLLRRLGPQLGKQLPRSTALRWDVDVDPTNLM